MAKKIFLISAVLILIITGDILGVHFYSKYLVGYTTTYVASHQISQRKKVSEEDLLEVEVPKDYLKEDVYTSKEEILNKYVKLSYTIPKGSLFYKSSLENTGKDIPNTLLMNNQVSYDVDVNEVKVNTGSLNKNMYVDLYLTIPNNGKPVSDLLLSNARIIGLYDSSNKEILNYDTDSKVSTISLAVDKNDVNYLNKALVLGDIKVIVSSSTYDTNVYSALNKESSVFPYIE